MDENKCVKNQEPFFSDKKERGQARCWTMTAAELLLEFNVDLPQLIGGSRL